MKFFFLVSRMKTSHSYPMGHLKKCSRSPEVQLKWLQENSVVIFRIPEIFCEQILYLLSISEFQLGRKFCHRSLFLHMNTVVLNIQCQKRQ